MQFVDSTATAAATVERVIPGTARYDLSSGLWVADIDVDEVGVASAEDLVVACPSSWSISRPKIRSFRVVTRADDVVPAKPLDIVGPAKPHDHIVTFRADDRVVPLGAHDRGTSGPCSSPPPAPTSGRDAEPADQDGGSRGCDGGTNPGVFMALPSGQRLSIVKDAVGRVNVRSELATSGEHGPTTGANCPAASSWLSGCRIACRSSCASAPRQLAPHLAVASRPVLGAEASFDAGGAAMAQRGGRNDVSGGGAATPPTAPAPPDESSGGVGIRSALASMGDDSDHSASQIQRRSGSGRGARESQSVHGRCPSPRHRPLHHHQARASQPGHHRCTAGELIPRGCPPRRRRIGRSLKDHDHSAPDSYPLSLSPLRCPHSSTCSPAGFDSCSMQ